MKVVILAGGFGTRISEESHLIPKPMITVGGMPIIWHIMKYFSSHEFNEFIICAGYKQNVIKEFFSSYYIRNCDIEFDLAQPNSFKILNNQNEKWKVTVVDTGLNTMTGGRLKRVEQFIGDSTFILTYGDGLADINLKKLIETHKENNSIITMSVFRPVGRFGIVDVGQDDKITSFREKEQSDNGWVNIGFMVCEPACIGYISDDSVSFENGPLQTLAKESLLSCYKHDGFWQCMDTKRDKELLEGLWEKGRALWKSW